MTTIGLSLISIAWVAQVTSKKPSTLNQSFVSLYTVGALVLATDGVMNGLWMMAGLNALTGVLVGLVGWKNR